MGHHRTRRHARMEIQFRVPVHGLIYLLPGPSPVGALTNQRTKVSDTPFYFATRMTEQLPVIELGLGRSMWESIGRPSIPRVEYSSLEMHFRRTLFDYSQEPGFPSNRAINFECAGGSLLRSQVIYA
jgi:hypothetical protein